MKPVSRLSQLRSNIRLLALYLGGTPGKNSEFAKSLIRRGICFVLVRHGRGHIFAPSRFVGYIGNSRIAHTRNQDKDGRETNRAIVELTGFRPRSSQRLEREYRAFCAALGISPSGRGSFAVSRKFWDLR